MSNESYRAEIDVRNIVGAKTRSAVREIVAGTSNFVSDDDVDISQRSSLTARSPPNLRRSSTLVEEDLDSHSLLDTSNPDITLQRKSNSLTDSALKFLRIRKNSPARGGILQPVKVEQHVYDSVDGSHVYESLEDIPGPRIYENLENLLSETENISVNQENLNSVRNNTVVVSGGLNLINSNNRNIRKMGDLSVLAKSIYRETGPLNSDMSKQQIME